VRLAAILLALSLSACSTVYVPAEIRSQEEGGNVNVISLSSASLLTANQSTSYTPRRLPAVFGATAGVGAGLRNLGTLPDSPALPELRPTSLELRLPPPVDRGPYVVGIGDVLVLATPAGGGSVEELTGLLAAQNRRQGYTVQDDGAITIPDVGRVQVGGMTLSAAEDSIFDRLIESQIDPSFSVEISEFNSQRVSIGGAVRNTSRAAALSELQAEISIRRAQLEEERGNFLARLDNGAVDRDYVYLTGEVDQPTRYPMPFGRQSSLADALFEAGGIAESTGDPGQIYVLRGDDATEVVTAWHLDGSNVANLVLATRFELRPNDIVFVAEQRITRWNRVIQQLVPSLVVAGVNAATN